MTSKYVENFVGRLGIAMPILDFKSISMYTTKLEQQKIVVKIEEPYVSDDMKRAAIVWGSISFPSNKCYTINEIYDKCTRQIDKRKLSFTISKEQINEVLDAAFFFATVTRGLNEDGSVNDYQIMMATSQQILVRG